jgi:HEAT repeat protein
VEVRELAAEALGRFGPEAKPALTALEGALQDSERSVRLSAALAMQRIEPPAASYQPVLIEALQAGDGTVFLAVARMEGDVQWAVPTLTALLSDPRSQIRALSAHALGRIAPRGDGTEAVLRRTLRDSEPAVQKAARDALRQLGSSAAHADRMSR